MLLGLGLVIASMIPAALDVTVDGTHEGVQVEASFASGEHVVRVDDFLLWLDESHPWVLERVTKNDRVVMLVEHGQPVAAVLALDWGHGQLPVPALNPLEKLNNLKTLRGISVHEAHPSFASVLSRLSGDRLCVSISSSTKLQRLPRIPPRTPCLTLTPNGVAAGVADLKALTRLRYATISTDLDAAWLGPAVEVLELYSSSNLRALAQLKALRVLSLHLGDFDGTGSYATLERLELTSLHSANLTHLVAPKLTELKVSATPLAELPPQLPALTTLSTMSTSLTPHVLSQFQAANPKVTVFTGWLGNLLPKLSGITRARVRPGGLCHLSDDDEATTLLEVTEAKALHDLVGSISIDEAKSDGICLCCGGPTIEFYRGETKVTELSLQHGAALRSRAWPADGELANDALVRWLAAHGVNEPLEEMKHTQRRAALALALQQRYAQLLPAKVLAVFEQILPPKREQVVELLKSVEPDLEARAVLGLRLLAARVGPWNSEGLVDRGASDLLETLPPSVLAKAMASSEPAVLDGATRFLFGRQQIDLVTTEALAAVLPPLARRALANPSADNRWATLVLLASAPCEATTLVLRELASGALVPLTDQALEENDADWAVFRPDPLIEALEKKLAAIDAGQVNVRESLSTKAIAAVLLAGRHDLGSAAVVAAVAKRATGLDAMLLQGAQRWAADAGAP